MSHIPENLYRAEQVRELDRIAIEDCGITGFDLMQRAAAASFELLKTTWPDARHIHVVCGPGNNGGDGLVLAALAIADEFDVSLELHCDPAALKGDALLAYQKYRDTGGQPTLDKFPEIGSQVVVDALLGTGTSRNVEGEFLEAVLRINDASARGTGVISLDIPSGLHADSGAVLGAAVKADATISFIGMKLGLLTGSGPEYTGELGFDDLGVPSSIYSRVPAAAVVTGDALRAKLLPPRSRDAHKNRHGHVLCVGGNYGTAGAIRLAAEAALRSGAGLVSVATRSEVAIAISQARPELMCTAVEVAEDLDPLLDSADVVLLGPGLGQDGWAKALWSKVIDSKLPLVLDADGLNLLAWNPCARGNWILTPHPGEAARLLNCEKSVIEADRVGSVQALADQYSAVALLKGAGSLIAGQDMPIHLCAQGNPGMATGGMGDLLSGIIAAFVGQGLSLLEATRLGVYVHANAGDAAAITGERGLIPSDLLPEIRRLVNP